MRVLFFGGHDFGKHTLLFLLEQGINVVGVYVTETEDPWYSGVDAVAVDKGIALWKSRDVNDPGLMEEFRTLQPDLIVVVNFDQILKGPLIQLPTKGCINTHAALLPKYRGRAPLNWAVIRGEKETGITVHYIDNGIDTGDILIQWKIPINQDTYISDLVSEAMRLYPYAVFSAIRSIESGTIIPIPQKKEVGFTCRKRSAEDGEIDWNSTSKEILNLIRGVSHPYPGAYTIIRGKKVIIWRARECAGLEGLEPGKVISAEPLRIAASKGAVEIIEYTAEFEPMRISEGDLCGAR